MDPDTTAAATGDTTAAADTTADTATTTTDTTTGDDKAATGDAGKGDQATTDADKAAADAATVPDTYAAPTELPEGVVWDQGLADALAPDLKAAGITQDAYNGLASKLAAHQAESIAKQWADVQTGWAESIAKDAELNANNGALKQAAVAGFAKFGTPEAKEAMEQLGWGNHPELVRVIGKLSLAAGAVEDTGTDSAASGGGARTLASRMYPTMT